MSSLSFDAETLTTLVNELLAASPQAKITAIAVARVGERVRLTLSGVRTGLSVFGMAVPPIDADLLMHGVWATGRLTLIWEIEALRGIPGMAAKLVGKPALAKMLSEALGERWGCAQALSATAEGDLVLNPRQLCIPGWKNLQIDQIMLPGSATSVINVEFTWGSIRR